MDTLSQSKTTQGQRNLPCWSCGINCSWIWSPFLSIFSTKLEGCLIVMALMLAIEMSRCEGGKISGGAGSGGGSDSMSESVCKHFHYIMCSLWGRAEKGNLKNLLHNPRQTHKDPSESLAFVFSKQTKTF